MSDDVFMRVHQLLKANMRLEALDMVYDKDRDQLKPPFDSDPNHAWYIVGDIFFKNQKFPQSIAAFELSVEFEPADEEAQLALANAYSSNDEWASAEKVLRCALDVDLNNESIRYNLANAFFDQEKYTEAVELYESISNRDEELYEMAQSNIRVAHNRLAEE